MLSSTPIRITPLNGSVRHARYSGSRLKVLQATEKRVHRYRGFRGLTMSFTLLALFAVPISGLAAFDLYGGEHRALFRPATPFVGLIAVAVAIFSFYFVTFQTNLVAGRMFCGWGCPIGQLNRLTDAVSAAKGRGRALWSVALYGFALVLSLSVSLWWVGPRAYLHFPASLIASAAVMTMTGGLIAFARIYGWAFCEKSCPIGLYYSVVQQRRPIGILFDASRCLDEAACVKACPVHLEPRDLRAPKLDIGGFAIDGLAGNNHCLRCGACVEACELVTTKIGQPALGFGRPAEATERPLPPIEAPIEASMPAPAAVPEPTPPTPAVPTTKIAALKTASAMIAGLAAIGGYLVLAGAPRYRPATTWEAPSKVSERAQRYRPADGSFASRELAGRVTKDGAPAAGAVVYWPSPAPGAPLPAGGVVTVLGSAGQWPDHDLVATVDDTLSLDNQGDQLHTYHVARNGRAVRQLSLPGRSRRALPPPPPGEYDLRCDNHSGEAVRLLVVDHPYFAITDASGGFVLRQVPNSPIELRAVGDGLAIQLSPNNEGPSRP